MAFKTRGIFSLIMVLLDLNLVLGISPIASCTYKPISGDKSPYVCEFSLNVVITGPSTSIQCSIKPPDGPNNLILVTSFSIMDQTINYFPSGIDKYLPHANSITIRNCELKEIYKNNLSPFQKLEYLDISYNLVETLEVKLFGSNIKLKTLRLNHNKIKIINEGTLKDLKSLTYLDLRDNVCFNEALDDQNRNFYSARFEAFLDRVEKICSKKYEVIIEVLRNDTQEMKKLYQEIKSLVDIKDINKNSKLNNQSNIGSDIQNLRNSYNSILWGFVVVSIIFTLIFITQCLFIIKNRNVRQKADIPHEVPMMQFPMPQQQPIHLFVNDVDYEEVQGANGLVNGESNYDEIPGNKIHYDEVCNGDESLNDYMEVGFNQGNAKSENDESNLPEYSTVDLTKKRAK